MGQKTYPVASGQVSKSNLYVGIPTGEFREPLKGEYYISGAIPEVYRAPNKLTIKFHICRLVPKNKI